MNKELYDKKSAIKYNQSLSYSKSEWKDIQHRLNKYSQSKPDLDVDGIPGKFTTDAVYTYQKENKCKSQNGKLDQDTTKLLGVKESNKDIKKSSTVQGKVKIPSGSTIMSKSYTPNLDLLSNHSKQEGYNVKNVDQSAKYVAKYCTGGSSQHQCTRGTSLFLQLASYARGEANKTYKSSCAANLFGSANSLTKYNISSSVASEYKIKSADNKSGKYSMNKFISNSLNGNGDFVTFKYAKSQHIVFYANGGWYSDFKQGTPSGCGNEKTLYSDIHYFTR
jgi:hypothetical protein